MTDSSSRVRTLSKNKKLGGLLKSIYDASKCRTTLLSGTVQVPPSRFKLPGLLVLTEGPVDLERVAAHFLRYRSSLVAFNRAQGKNRFLAYVDVLLHTHSMCVCFLNAFHQHGFRGVKSAVYRRLFYTFAALQYDDFRLVWLFRSHYAGDERFSALKSLINMARFHHKFQPSYFKDREIDIYDWALMRSLDMLYKQADFGTVQGAASLLGSAIDSVDEMLSLPTVITFLHQNVFKDPAFVERFVHPKNGSSMFPDGYLDEVDAFAASSWIVEELSSASNMSADQDRNPCKP